jgi:hypothetical protein
MQDPPTSFFPSLFMHRRRMSMQPSMSHACVRERERHTHNLSVLFCAKYQGAGAGLLSTLRGVKCQGQGQDQGQDQDQDHEAGSRRFPALLRLKGLLLVSHIASMGSALPVLVLRTGTSYVR